MKPKSMSFLQLLHRKWHKSSGNIFPVFENYDSIHQSCSNTW